MCKKKVETTLTSSYKHIKQTPYSETTIIVFLESTTFSVTKMPLDIPEACWKAGKKRTG